MALDEVASGAVCMGVFVSGTALGFLHRLGAFAVAGSFMASTSVFILMPSKKYTTIDS
jgi:hypothetical protein